MRMRDNNLNPKVELGFARIHRIVNLTDRIEWRGGARAFHFGC